MNEDTISGHDRFKTEEYYVGERLLRDKILPVLNQLFFDINSKYDECLEGINLLKNISTETHLYINENPLIRKMMLNVLFSFNCELDLENKALAYTLTLYDYLRKTFDVFLDISTVNSRYPKPTDFLIYRRTLGTGYNGGFCVQSRSNFESEKSGFYRTVSDCISDPIMGMSYFVHDFPMYSWTLKQRCINVGPVLIDTYKSEKLVEYAALVHYWAKKNYLRVPEWVLHRNCFFDQKSVPDTDNIPREFLLHGWYSPESNYVHV